MASIPQSNDTDFLNGSRNRIQFLLSTRNSALKIALPSMDKSTLDKWDEEASNVVILYLTDFKLQLIRKDLKGHFILKKGNFNRECIMILNICVSIPDVLNFIKSVLLILQIQTNYPLVISDLHTLLSSSGQKISRGTSEVNGIIHKMDSTVIYNMFHTNTKEYTHPTQHPIEASLK